MMNASVGRWKKFTIPLSGDSNWKKTAVGSPSLADIDQIQIHVDTWDYGFTVNLDGLHFEKLDSSPPTAVISSPANGSYVSGVVPMTVTASDNNVVNRVDIAVDGQYLATDAMTPYVFFWDSSTMPLGEHTFIARAVDFAGNETYSAPIKLNSSSPPPPSTNLLKNPGFELDANSDGRPDNWSSNSRFTRSDVLSYSGSSSGRHFATDNSGFTISQAVTGITGGKTYAFDSWTNIPATTDSFSYKIQIRWLNSSGSTISTSTIKTYTAATVGWNEAKTNLVAPGSAVKAQVRMVIKSLNAKIYADDFSLVGL